MAQTFSPGSILNARYEISAFLGGGGFGHVYRGRDVIIGREVAIKILNFNDGEHPLAGDAEVREGLVARFRREAQVAAQIHHPNVITIHDIGITDDGQGNPFLVMQLLQGHDLYTELARHGPIPLPRAVRLFIGCLDALSEAHTLGIVHKDLKPENLFIQQPGTHRENLTIFDFGISHVIQDSRLTVMGQMIGTPGYMAPEYITRQDVSAAFDVYQMGLILAEALTGTPLVYDEDPVRCFGLHERGALALPRPLADSKLGAVLAKALVPDPALRYPHAGAFHDALVALDPGEIAFDPRATHEAVPIQDVASQHGMNFDAAFPKRLRSAAASAPRTASDSRPTVAATPTPRKNLGARITTPEPTPPDTPRGFGRPASNPPAEPKATAAAPATNPHTLDTVPAGKQLNPAVTDPGGRAVGTVDPAALLPSMPPARAEPARTDLMGEDLTGDVRAPHSIASALAASAVDADDAEDGATSAESRVVIVPASSQPPSYRTEPLRSVVESEQEVTRRWGFLLVTGVLGLMLLLTCPVASVVYVGVARAVGPTSATATTKPGDSSDGSTADEPKDKTRRKTERRSRRR